MECNSLSNKCCVYDMCVMEEYTMQCSSLLWSVAAGTLKSPLKDDSWQHICIYVWYWLMLTRITKLKALNPFTTLRFKLCRKICTCAIYFCRIAVCHSPIDLYIDDCTLCMYTCIYMYNTIYMASHLHPIHWHMLYIQEYIIYRHTYCILHAV